MRDYTEGSGELIRQRPISSSFNELTRRTSTTRRDHELHYFKNYTSLTEYELIILRKTAFTNLRNQFRNINNPQGTPSAPGISGTQSAGTSTHLLPSYISPTNGKVSTSNSSLNKSEQKPNPPDNNNSIHLLPQLANLSNSFTNLSGHHSHSNTPTPGKDLRESVIKTLENINRGRTNKKWKIFTSKKDKKKEVFGVPLVTSLEYAFVYIDPTENCNNKKIPIVVYECINFIRKNGITKEGIFRVNGSERRINNSLKIFNESGGYGFGYDFDGMNVFDAASILKLYLRQLPEPIVPFCLYTSFLDVIKYIPDRNDRVRAFQYLFMMLPSAHLILLEILLQFLHEVTQHSDENHMNAHNLACIFAPNILRPKDNNSSGNLLVPNSSEEYEIALQAMEFLITNKSKFCITAPNVKPFQIFNKFEKGPVNPDNENEEEEENKVSGLEGLNSLSITDISSFQSSRNLNKYATFNVKNLGSKGSVFANDSKLKDGNNLGVPEISDDSINTTSTIMSSNNEDASTLHSHQTNDNEKNQDEKKNEGGSDGDKQIKDNSIDSIKIFQSKNNPPISISNYNMKSETSEGLLGTGGLGLSNPVKSLNNISSHAEDADINTKPYHPNVEPIKINNINTSINNLNCTSPTVLPLTLKCKSNLENVRTHSNSSFYCVNTCPLVSTSLNRLNYLPIKHDDIYEYLSRDDDNINQAIANEISHSPTKANQENNPTLTSAPITNESISVSSFNQPKDENQNTTNNNTNNNKSNNDNTNNDNTNNRPSSELLSPEMSSPEIPSPDVLDKRSSYNQEYPPDIMTMPERNRENSELSFLSPLSTASQPVLCIPPPPVDPPIPEGPESPH